MRTYKTLGGALAAILLLILTQLIAQGAAGLLAMIKLPAGVCNIIAGILYAGLAYAALRLLSEKVLHEHTAALGMPKLHIQPRWAITAVLLPLLYLYAGTVICGTTLENDVLASLSGLLRKAFRLLLIGFASVFTLYLSLTGILTGSADAAAAKAVKTAVSAALPVVGSIVADAASTVTSSAAILRSGIGVVGVVSVAAMCVTPYLQFVMHYVLYKLAAGIAESFADKRVGRLIDGFADVYGFLLGMVGVASLILFLSIVSSMKAVTG